jgi:hypothetical protein
VKELHLSSLRIHDAPGGDLAPGDFVFGHSPAERFLLLQFTAVR